MCVIQITSGGFASVVTRQAMAGMLTQARTFCTTKARRKEKLSRRSNQQVAIAMAHTTTLQGEAQLVAEVPASAYR